MIIGFSNYGAGGSGPALDYLTGYLVGGQARDPKPEVVRGDPALVAQIIDSLPFERRYSSGVLSFAPEDRVTPEIQEDIINRFEKTVFAGIPPDRRSIVWIKHGDKGRHELHFVVPRVDLGTGKSLNIAPPTPASRQLLDTLRESINRRYGFRDPGDPGCAQSVSLPNHIAKLAAQARRLGQSARPDIRQTLTERLEEQARAGSILSRADVNRWLKEQGFGITREGVNYVTITRPDTGERVRLKGNIFRQHFSPQELVTAPAPQDPTRLFRLDRQLERLAEKRAAFHRARYGTKETDLTKESHDRTGEPITHRRPTLGAVLPGSRTAVCPDARRLDEAAQQFCRANHELERTCERLGEAHRTVARDFEQTLNNARQMALNDSLIQTYGLHRQNRGQSRDMDLELELQP
jgi:hypothetical protein